MMANLPKTRAEAVQVTSAQCPKCHVTGKAKISATKGPGWLYCTWCNAIWKVPADPASPLG